MKIEFSKEWFKKMAELEGDSPIGAGTYGLRASSITPQNQDETNVVFGRFVRLMRRQQGLTVEQLADRANIDLSELVDIEDDSRYKPGPRTVYQLANFFSVPDRRLMQIAGLTSKMDVHLQNEGARFAARSDPVAQLTPEERAALDAFIVALNEQD
ncbi:Helix-turn-helix domain protein [Pseudomonas ogarae]|uniref:helix-turn-helix domain-containing protein n=1 Tax=Pseudomonas ogarae (strain DSM 112162 / CECT 30235 / F113) TaxID=1114970 RepID=UPI000BB2EB11|nr:helix-turn-helix transcriptional regulator [Pseudomonas ogarae]PBJ21585.1 Helix-turn-helix domain protein [Pseudomonas ogarae]